MRPEQPARPDPRDLGEIDAEVGVALRRARGAAGMTRASLARAIGIDELALARCEAGSRRLGPQEMFAAVRALGIRPADLYA